jgi:ribonuclease HII
MIVLPTWQTEKTLWKQGITPIVGVDEVGRGALAGPVVAAAVIFSGEVSLSIPIRDSKLLTRKQREVITPQLKLIVQQFSIGYSSPHEIDTIGIVAATHKAMRQAIHKLTLTPQFILVDGLQKISRLPKDKQMAIVKGDQKSFSIAAASIIAKVYRDQLMRNWHEKFPEYGFDRHVGYGTALHRHSLKKLGVTKIHRLSFIKNLLISHG